MNNVLLAFASAALAAGLAAQDPRPAADTGKPDKSWTSVAAMPATCVVSGHAMKPEKMKTIEVEGRTYQVCCAKCPAKIEADPAKYAQKQDEMIIAAQAASYPLTKCPVSGKDLGKEPKQIVLAGTLVRLCCPGCAGKAEKRADEIAAKIEAAAHDQQAKAYPMETCVISGDPLGDDAVDVMYGTTLVRLCCEGCIDELKKDAATPLAALATARAAKDGKAQPSGDETSAPAKPAGKGGADGAAAGCCGEGSGGACCEAKGGAGGCCGEKQGK